MYCVDCKYYERHNMAAERADNDYIICKHTALRAKLNVPVIDYDRGCDMYKDDQKKQDALTTWINKMYRRVVVQKGE